MVKKNVYDEKEYRVSRDSSTQGIYFQTNKGDSYAKTKGKKLWEQKYGKADDIYIQRWIGFDGDKRRV